MCLGSRTIWLCPILKIPYFHILFYESAPLFLNKHIDKAILFQNICVSMKELSCFKKTFNSTMMEWSKQANHNLLNANAFCEEKN